MADNDGDNTTRRRVLKAGGSMGAMALVGGAGVLASTGSAAAEVSVNSNEVSAANPDGEIEGVYITPKGGISWENFDEQVDHIHLKIESRVTKKNETALTGWRTAFENTWDLKGEAALGNSFDVGPILGAINLYGDAKEGEAGGSTEYFNVSADGATVRRRVELRFTVDLLHGDRLADPKSEANIVEEAAFYADSTNEEATSGISVDNDAGMD
ncbi:hypothetical protein [Candidatus Halobonum tyrrellensis]|nr:hypothetical protein [Candidatus Halobonum tyrrellensis]